MPFSAVRFLQRKVVTHPTVVPEVALVIGKVRVAPMKTLKIPKLQLLVALLVSQFTAKFHRTSTIQTYRTLMWTDNTTVGNTVARIFDVTTEDECNHVQSDDNPTEVGTRGNAASAFMKK